MLRSVAVVLQEPVALFEFAVAAEVFGIDRSADGVPKFDFRICAQTPGALLRATGGARVGAPLPLSAADDADLVVIPASETADSPSKAVKSLVRATVDRGAYLMSVCSGAFTLAAAGVLDGRKCATHWLYTERLAREYPHVDVDGDSLYVHDGTIITSAGTAAGIDACLYLVRLELGADISARIARRMVVPPHRDGGQRQFIERPIPQAQDTRLTELLAWVGEHLADEHSVATLATRAHMSTRTFARRFTAEVGTTPGQWLIRQRVLAAKEMLTGSAASVESIATAVGFGSATLLRHHFAAQVGLSPSAYRQRFSEE